MLKPFTVFHEVFNKRYLKISTENEDFSFPPASGEKPTKNEESPDDNFNYA